MGDDLGSEAEVVNTKPAAVVEEETEGRGCVLRLTSSALETCGQERKRKKET